MISPGTRGARGSTPAPGAGQAWIGLVSGATGLAPTGPRLVGTRAREQEGTWEAQAEPARGGGRGVQALGAARPLAQPVGLRPSPPPCHLREAPHSTGPSALAPLREGRAGHGDPRCLRKALGAVRTCNTATLHAPARQGLAGATRGHPGEVVGLGVPCGVASRRPHDPGLALSLP